MPAQTNWVRFRLLLIAIGLQSLSMKIFYASISSLSARNGKSWLTFRWLVVDLLSRWTGFDSGSSELFLSLSCCRKRLFVPPPFLSARNGKSYWDLFSGVRGFECRCWQNNLSDLWARNFLSLVCLNVLRFKCQISPGSRFDARELLGLFSQCDRKKIGRRKIFSNKSSRNFDVL